MCRIVVDSWLELQFQNGAAGVRALAAVQKLRATMNDLLKTKLELHSQQCILLTVMRCVSSSLDVFRSDTEVKDEEGSREALFSKQRQVNKLTSVLSDKLSEFLSSSFPYSLKRVPSTHVANLYRGPTESKICCTGHVQPICWCLYLDPEQVYNNISLLLLEGHKASDKKAVQHPIKGGYVITDYLTYDW